jgi:N-acetylglutamate synthase-like GNAT family acetyltransferase
LLLHNGRPIGVVRLDLRGATAIVRLVAIAETEQRKGHGRKLNALVEAEARRRGVRLLRVNAAPDAVGYYERMGWRHSTWDKRELVGLARPCVQMTKDL